MSERKGTGEGETLRKKLEDKFHSTTKILSCERLTDLILPIVLEDREQFAAQKTIDTEDELLDFALEVIQQYAYEPSEGVYTSGGLSTLETAFGILRDRSMLNKNGQYVPAELSATKEKL